MKITGTTLCSNKLEVAVFKKMPCVYHKHGEIEFLQLDE